MDSSDSFILIGGVAVIAKFVIYDKIIEEWNKGPSFLEELSYLFSFFWVKVFLITSAVLIFIFLNIYFHKLWLRRAIKRNKEEELSLFDNSARTMTHIEISSLKDIDKKRITKLLKLVKKKQG